MNISKELLSEVLENKVVDIEVSSIENKVGFVLSGSNQYLFINIHELAFLIRDYLKEKYAHTLDMSLDIEKIFTNATQFHESML